MNKCICGKEISDRAKTCSATCRSRLARSVASDDESVANATVNESVASSVASELPANFGQADCQCWHCKGNRINKNKNVINHGPYKTAAELGLNEINRVTLPGDIDYDGVCNDAKYDSHRTVRRIGPAST